MSIFQILLSSLSKNEVPALGPEDILDGDVNAAYYGEVPVGELFTSAELAEKVGLNIGTQMNISRWFKVSYGEKILYIPSGPMRYGVSWTQLYLKGLVYGTDDNGKLGQSPPTNQATVVSKDRHYFLVRLMRSTIEDPTGITAGIELPYTKESEWDSIMYNLIAKDSTTSNRTGRNWTNHDRVSFGFRGTSVAGAHTLCQERVGSNVIARGPNNPYEVLPLNVDTTHDRYAWRPVLEYLGRLPVFKPVPEAYEASFIAGTSIVSYSHEGAIQKPLEIHHTSKVDIVPNSSMGFQHGVFIQKPTEVHHTSRVDIVPTSTIGYSHGTFIRKPVEIHHTSQFDIVRNGTISFSHEVDVHKPTELHFLDGSEIKPNSIAEISHEEISQKGQL